MLQETLLIFSCLNGYSCDKTSATYAYYNPLVIERVEELQNSLENRLNPVFKSSVLPIILAGASNQINITLTRNVFLNVNNNGRLSVTINVTLK